MSWSFYQYRFAIWKFALCGLATGFHPGAAETSAFHYNAAVNACATSGLWQSALDLLLLGVKNGRWGQDGRTISSVIPYHCSFAAGEHKGHTRHDSNKNLNAEVRIRGALFSFVRCIVLYCRVFLCFVAGGSQFV